MSILVQQYGSNTRLGPILEDRLALTNEITPRAFRRNRFA